MSTGTDRPAAFWLAWHDDGPEPWGPASRDTLPAPTPSAGRYCLIDPDRAAMGAPPPAPASRVRACRQTDPCIVPPPGSDRMGDGRDRVAILPPPWAPVRGAGASNTEGKG